ncbi:MAG: SDR family NAD(P)-dependent oxidoreductase, partial [Candidatus Promineifilaceae bacterium]
MHGLSGKRVLITGGARGIGAASAKKFMDEGARTAILDIDPEAIQKIQAVYPGIELALAADVSDHQAVASSFKVLDEIFGGLDILINNAGISIQHSFLDITPDEWQRVIGVDLDGAFYTAQQAARRMMAAGGGVIINMASTNALRGYPWYADYNAAKAGVLSLTKTMA